MYNIVYTKGTQRLIDAVIYALAWLAAFQIRFDAQLPAIANREMLVLLLPFTAGQVGLTTLFGVYRFKWRYITPSDALRITGVQLLFSLIVLAVRSLLSSSLSIFQVPLSVIAITFVLSTCGCISARFAWRAVYQAAHSKERQEKAKRFLLVGAGIHGVTVAREMLLHRGIDVIGFLDDDPNKKGAVIAGIPVLGRIVDLKEIVSVHHIDEVLVCISPKSRHLLQIVGVELPGGGAVPSRIIPRLEELLENPGMREASVSPGSVLNHANVSDINNNGKGPLAAVAAKAVDGNIATGTLRGTNSHATNLYADGDPLQSRSVNGAHEIQVVPTAGATAVVQNRTVMITGGAGFIGSSLAEKLADSNHVIVFDKVLTESAPIHHTKLLSHPNVTFIAGDILDSDLRSIVRKADVIIHAAAILGVSKVCSSGRETLETNYVGTSRLLKAIDGHPNIRRFVYFSTSEVFGVNSYNVDESSRPTVGPIAESRWSYAMAKLAGEHLVASYFRETKLPITIVRPFNVFGPRRTGDYALRRFIVSALRNDPLEVHGDGTQIRSWCYIEDLVSALLQMIERPEAVGQDFNIGNPNNTLTVRELAQKVIELTNSTSPIHFREAPFPDISIRVPSLEKARRLLGYEPQYDLSTGLKHTIEWHRHNLDSRMGAVTAKPIAAAFTGAVIARGATA